MSYNRLVRLDDGVFSELNYLTHLDLSHNKQLLLESRGRTFHGLEDSLLYLDLSNISLLSVRTRFNVYGHASNVYMYKNISFYLFKRCQNCR